MQEEVEQKTVNFAVKSTKVSADLLYKGMTKFVSHCKRKAQERRVASNESKTGKQTVKELIGQGQGVSSIPIADDGIKDFKKICNKYGVDFAIVKDKESIPMQYTVFFKAKDTDAITQVIKEYSARQVKKEAEKPSIIKKLQQFKEKLANVPKREKEKTKERVL